MSTVPHHSKNKREMDLQILGTWIEEGASVLDLGCGRGVLLDYLRQTRHTYGVGVDIDPLKIRSCVKKGLNVYQGDAEGLLRQIPDGFYDWVVISRTLQELHQPATVLREALRVGRHLAISFVNYGYWINRWSTLRTGHKVTNEVFPQEWENAPPHNPVTILSFEDFCRRHSIEIERKVYLAGDWHRSVRTMPNLRAGYALYALSTQSQST